jgi:hypothetical protein
VGVYAGVGTRVCVGVEVGSDVCVGMGTDVAVFVGVGVGGTPAMRASVE